MARAEPGLDIRSAAAEEVPGAVAAIVAGFLTDPVMRFAWPAPRAYLEGAPRVAGLFAAAAAVHRTVDVDADLCAAALWLPPGVHADGEALGRAFGETCLPAHRDDLFGTFEQIGAAHPDQPHWYLPMIGVEPNAQGRGLGAALLRHALERCDRDGAIAYLESSNPRNIGLYERHGFEVIGRIQVGKGPLVTPMLRPAR